ncbi:hypothetical protein [Trinickia diaoshuihuensis]|uniref:hypothetical protein n=1 Tax=Trinickia diaoshuihuensis TaxID=2292265 RepID=UPI00196732A4|nr:hypothetical protein [Trinickia diaoshuihuensis]
MTVSNLVRSTAAGRQSLAQAIAKGLPSFVDANMNYLQNVCIVNTYVNNVMSSTLPVVPVQPKDWDKYVSAWEQADGIALQWVNTCMARLLQVPQEVQGYNGAITNLLQDAITQTNALIVNPNNQAAKIALNQDLTALPQQLQVVESFISGAITALQGFQDQLPTMAAQLTQLSNLAIADNQADQRQIQRLQQDIEQLQNDIDSRTSTIIGLAIADGAILTLGVVSSIVFFPAGLLTWFVLGPAVAVATTVIALDAEQIKADKALIGQDQSQMNELTASCAVLAIMSTTYTTFANQSEQIQAALQAVLAEWQALSSDIATSITDIQTAVNDECNNNYQAVLTDLNGAAEEWEAADTQAASLVLTLNVNNAQLQIGMSQNQVQSALAGGQTYDVITYFNQIAA